MSLSKYFVYLGNEVNDHESRYLTTLAELTKFYCTIFIDTKAILQIYPKCKDIIQGQGKFIK